MGEVRIKSGNLFDGELEQGSLNSNDGSEVVNNTRVRTVGNTLLKEGTYTINCAGATGGVVVCAYNTDDLSYDKAASYVGQWRSLPFTFVVDNERLYRFAFKKANDSVIVPSEVTDIQLLEGTYTSSTIPEYQPYFLNHPAHQFINGEWIDIPTHHFINGRWQGELTSQSPLKFRADGEMLDWRVEGKTSGNLFDIGDVNGYTGPPSISIDGDVLDIHVVGDGLTYKYRKYNYTSVGQFTICGKSSSNLCRFFVRLRNLTNTGWLTSADVSLGRFIYNSAFGGWYANLASSDFSKTFTIPSSVCSYWQIGFGFGSDAGVGTDKTFEKIMLLSGTYTTETIPPYEPYGGVGDYDETEQKYKISVTVNGVTTNLYTDHQLMDGDSIDYTTTETTIPLATGNNTLTVDTAVKPKSVFVKFEG